MSSEFQESELVRTLTPRCKSNKLLVRFANFKHRNLPEATCCHGAAIAFKRGSRTWQKEERFQLHEGALKRYQCRMPKISFVRGRAPLEVPMGSQLMQALLDADIPVASSCSGEGVCCKCVLKIIEGKENLSPIGELESDLKDMHDLSKNERVSCQATVLGDVTVDAPYW